jgi:FkbH-like protein
VAFRSLSIASTFTSEPISSAVRFWLRAFGHEPGIQFAPYNQVLQSLLDPYSVLSRKPGDVNLLLVRLVDWVERPFNERFKLILRARAEEFVGAVGNFASQSSSSTFVIFCPTNFEAVSDLEPSTGGSSKAVADSFSGRAGLGDVVAAAENRIATQLLNFPGLTVLNSRNVDSLYPVKHPFDPISDRTGHIPFNNSYFAALGTFIARRIVGQRRRPTKVVVLDCDNTLWSGVCGEVGAQGVLIEPGHRELQQRLLALRERGILLALCSKNIETDVWSVFEQNDEMVLRREHLAAVEINWQEKSTGLVRLAQRLGLGLESFLFLDDNPLEIAEVRARCPQVLSLQIPAVAELPEFLDHLWALDQTAMTTADDQIRAESYRTESIRQAERKKYISLRSFLENLELQVRFLDIDESNLARAAQLIDRTNQFNLTLKRRSAAELGQELVKPATKAFLVEVTDKFGNYGLVGIAICSLSANELIVDTLALSCRALGRGVEHQVLRRIGQIATENNLSTISIPFVQGERNEPAARFLCQLCKHLQVALAAENLYQFPASRITELDPMQFCEPETVLDPVLTRSSSAEASSSSLLSQPSELLNQIATQYRSVERIVQRLAEDRQPRPDFQEPFARPSNELESRIAAICSLLLRIDSIGVDDPLNQLGASSLQLVQIHSRLVQELELDLSIPELYNLPTVSAIAEFTKKSRDHGAPAAPPTPSTRIQPSQPIPEDNRTGIAIIGMAGRFPGADSVSELWQNLIDEVNCIVPLSDNELNLAPDSPLRFNPNLVKKSSSIRDADRFDAKFFGIFPKEAKVMDPQHRLMLECCWTALENGGYCPDRVEQSVGVYAGCYMDTYILASLQSNPELINSLANSFHGGDLHTELGNDKDYLASRISYLLNLRGPAMTIQTACSTSLVAIIQACEAIENGHCQLALAGGATLKFPQGRGYLYTEGGMVSPDGICRPFDADARGTVFGEGIAVVLLKQLDRAIADRDAIYGVIRGWGINNDGRSKMAYTAPSVTGQSAAIEMAHRKAGFSADTISYVEAHGTGTSLGDPIEVEALTKAFRKSTTRKRFCGIGSLKSNIGHLDVAAGATGLIKICQALQHQTIPASLHVKNLNPNIDFENSPFYVVTKAQPWTRNGGPRRAGLSSFGVGGTNAHIVVEEAPIASSVSDDPSEQLLVLSARSSPALEQATKNLASHLKQYPDLNLADLAHTLRIGRKDFVHKRVLVARDVAEAIRLLESPQAHASTVFTQNESRRKTGVDFVFPGQGSQHLGMAAGLYQADHEFRRQFDECIEILKPFLGFDLREKIFASDSETNAAAMNQTGIAQPAIFSVAYSLAKRMNQFGIVPLRMVGHSVGEFVAACLAGVFSLRDALRLISFRATQMQILPAGCMLAVRIKEEQLPSFLLHTAVEIAAINSPELCVISGPRDAIAEVQQKLEAADFVCRSLQTSHAFHSEMMDPVIKPFEEQFAGVELCPPSIPIISSVTGKRLTDEQACDPRYWARHLRETVRFSDAVGELLGASENIVLEVGPGQALSTLVRQHSCFNSERLVLSLSPHAKVASSSYRHCLLTLGRLWQNGVSVDWLAMPDAKRCRRVHLPSYPFERQRYWFDEIPVANSSNLIPFPQSEPGESGNSGAFEEQNLLPSGSTTPTLPSGCPPDPPPPSVAQQVIRQQLQLMQQQLELWRR